MSKLAKELGLEKRPGPLPPKYQPKIRLRIGCDRSKQVMEFSVDIPIDGLAPVAAAKIHDKLDDIFRRLGILAPNPEPERDNAQGNLQADEESQTRERYEPRGDQEKTRQAAG